MIGELESKLAMMEGSTMANSQQYDSISYEA